MKRISKDELERESNLDLNINELAEKLAKEKNISTQEAKLQIENLTEPNVD